MNIIKIEITLLIKYFFSIFQSKFISLLFVCSVCSFKEERTLNGKINFYFNFSVILNIFCFDYLVTRSPPAKYSVTRTELRGDS